MTKHRFSVTERIQYQAENAPRFHRVIVELGVYLTQIYAIVRGSLTISGGTANGTSLGENPGNLFCQRIEVNADPAAGSGYPGGQLVSAGPRTLLRRRVFDRGFYQNDYYQAAGITGAAGTFSFALPFEIPFALPRLVKPFDTALRLGAYADVMMKITNGSRAAQFSGNDRTFDYSAMVWDIVEYREYAGDYASLVLYNDDKLIPVNNSSARFPVNSELQQPEAFLDALWIGETTNQVLSDGVINRVQLFTGTELFYDQETNHIKLSELEFVADAAQATGLSGLYYTPIVKDGQLGGAQTGLTAVLDVTKTGTDQIWLSTRRVARPRAA